jgi:hypothetical protein
MDKDGIVKKNQKGLIRNESSPFSVQGRPVLPDVGSQPRPYGCPHPPVAPSKLSYKQIVDAFPSECKKLIPKMIKETEKELAQHKKFIRIVNDSGVDDFTKWFYIECSKLFLDQEPVKRWEELKRLRKYYMTTKKNNKEGRKTIDWDEEKNRAKLVPIVELYDWEKKKASKKYVMVSCPFGHKDKTPSMCLYLKENSYYCFSCNSGGDNIHFIMKLYNMDFKQAIRYLNGL